MHRYILSTFFLGTSLLLGSASRLQGQSTHLGVPPRQLVKVNYLALWDGTTFTAFWGDYAAGINTSDGSKSFVVPAGKTLILTDVEVTIQCLSPVTTAPSLQLSAYIADPAGNPLCNLSRFVPTRQTVGAEMQRTPLTGGYAVPAGCQIIVDPIAPGGVPTHYLRRVNLLGYYVQ